MVNGSELTAAELSAREAALEPHFAHSLFQVAGLPPPDARAPFAPSARAAIAAWAAGKTRRQLDALAEKHDIPLLTLK